MMRIKHIVSVDKEKCIGCGLCVADCWSHVITIKNKKAEVISDECLKCGHCIAVCPKDAFTISGYDQDEIKTYNGKNFEIGADVLLNAIQFRRSVRQYDNKSVEKDKIEKIIEAGRFTPTGSNKQNVRYIVVEDNIAFLENEALKYYIRVKRLTSLLGNLIHPSDDLSRYELAPGFLFYGAPTLIFAVSTDDVNASLASMSMELMAESMGLGTVYVRLFTNVANKNKKIRKFLSLDKKENLVTCLATGYPHVRYLRTVPREKPDIKWE
jgi:nitroreductase/NAD-dependent dihydropyrimidine dehydrogenase PreA subunit